MARDCILDRVVAPGARLVADARLALARASHPLARRLRAIRRPGHSPILVIKHLHERLRLARRLLGQLRGGGLPGTLLLFGTVSYGDDLLCTAVFH